MPAILTTQHQILPNSFDSRYCVNDQINDTIINILINVTHVVGVMNKNANNRK